MQVKLFTHNSFHMVAHSLPWPHHTLSDGQYTAPPLAESVLKQGWVCSTSFIIIKAFFRQFTYPIPHSYSKIVIKS